MSDRLDLNDLADEVADALGVDPEDVGTMPGKGALLLTAKQVRALLDLAKEAS